MELKTTRNEYSAPSRYLTIDPETGEIRAYSYSWWQFIATDKVGNLFFLDRRYSHSTSNHQNEARSILSRLGIRIDHRIDHTASCGDNFRRFGIKGVLNSEIEAHRGYIRSLIGAIKKKGSHKRKNEARKSDIRHAWYKIQDIRNIRDNYLDQERIPYKKRSLESFYAQKFYSGSNTMESWEKYFRKDNGKLKRNQLQTFLNEKGIDPRWNSAPRSIDKIQELFEVKKSNVVSILTYSFANDLEGMIPDQDASEYILLKRHMKRLGIQEPTPLNLDKIHEYLKNKINRKNYTPRPPVEFPVHKDLLALESKKIKGLRLIKTDQALRAEGRRQSHCIGSKNYIESCKRGYQALNYKGYTFFLTPELNISQTYGRFNVSTPRELRLELEGLLLLRNYQKEAV